MSAVETSVSPMMEIVDFVLSRPSHEEIVAFRYSPEVQELASELLQKNREGTLTLDEKDELDQLTHLELFMQLLKAKAHLLLKQPPHD